MAVAWAWTATADEVPPGLKAGDFVAPFDVQDVTGPNQGKKLCYRRLYGGRTVEDAPN